jgi:hypothetical protein
MLGRVRRHCIGSNRPQVNALGLVIEPPRRVPPRSPLQVMDDRVPLRRRHLQLGLNLARQAAVVRSGEPEAEKDSRRIPSRKWSPMVSHRVEASLLLKSSPSNRRAPNLRLGA